MTRSPSVLALLHLPFALLCLSLLALPGYAEDEKPTGESARRWARMARMDTDGDGQVSREEFRGPDRLFARMDGDGDGHITQKEVGALSGRMGGARAGPRGDRGRLGSSRGGGLSLAKLDLDKDGKISKREWAAFFKKADENEDDFLQSEEWEAAIGEKPLRDDAPKVGSVAPKVTATLQEAPIEVDLGSPKRTTVLIFGSWT